MEGAPNVAQGAAEDVRLANSIDANERLRARARAAATLIAAAAGALAAGIVLSPGAALPPFAEASGAGAVLAFVLATSAFVGASFAYSASISRSPWARRALLLFMFWRVNPAQTNNAPTNRDLLHAASRVHLRITTVTNIAIWIAGVGVATLMAALIAVVIDPPATVAVSLRDQDTLLDAVCPGFKDGAQASVERSELDGSAMALTLTFSAETCGGLDDIIVTLPRQDVALTIDGAPR